MDESFDKSIPKTDFKPLKKPYTFEQKEQVKYKKNLDEFYSNDWITQYFKISDTKKN